MRVFQTSSLAIFAAVLHSTSRPSRSPAWMPSHWPIRPPMDSPQKCTRGSSRASSKASTSAPSWPMAYGPGVTSEAPWPRVS